MLYIYIYIYIYIDTILTEHAAAHAITGHGWVSGTNNVL